MPLINFKVKSPENIVPFGREPNTSMHWFGLTDGDYWLKLRDKTLYEYSDAKMQLWNGRPTRYSGYYIVRLIEDLTDLFPVIAESVPASLYDIAKTYSSLNDLQEKNYAWIDTWPDEETADSAANDQQHDLLTRWVYTRTLYSSHLKGGPHLSFFRHEDKISLVWKADQVDDNEIPYWTAGNGQLEMDYHDFIYQVEDFGNRFFPAMAAQIALAVDRDWGSTKLDKARLVQEQQERKADFERQLAILKQGTSIKTDWDPIKALVKDICLK
jgi:flavodoxin